MSYLHVTGDRGSNPGPFADHANTLPSHPVISPTTFHL